jgi:hypothetical protein
MLKEYHLRDWRFASSSLRVPETVDSDKIEALQQGRAHRDAVEDA